MLAPLSNISDFLVVRKLSNGYFVARCGVQDLNLPRKQKHRVVDSVFLFWCEKRDLNPYSVNYTPLKRARLPVPPLSHKSFQLCAQVAPQTCAVSNYVPFRHSRRKFSNMMFFTMRDVVFRNIGIILQKCLFVKSFLKILLYFF